MQLTTVLLDLPRVILLLGYGEKELGNRNLGLPLIPFLNLTNKNNLSFAVTIILIFLSN